MLWAKTAERYATLRALTAFTLDAPQPSTPTRKLAPKQQHATASKRAREGWKWLHIENGVAAMSALDQSRLRARAAKRASEELKTSAAGADAAWWEQGDADFHTHACWTARLEVQRHGSAPRTMVAWQFASARARSGRDHV